MGPSHKCVLVGATIGLFVFAQCCFETCVMTPAKTMFKGRHWQLRLTHSGVAWSLHEFDHFVISLYFIPSGSTDATA